MRLRDWLPALTTNTEMPKNQVDHGFMTKDGKVTDLAPENVSAVPGEKFREYLETQGMRLTQERDIVVREIFADHEHFETDEIVSRLTKQRTDGTRVSRATIYRTIGHLENAGLIRKVARANDREVYEHDYGYPQHDHFICDRCNSLIEFRNEKISEILETIAADHGFRRTGHRLEVHGICAQCARPPSRRHHKLDMV